MKERPILFSGPMVRAILEDRKTQTRRVVKLPLHCRTTGCELTPGELSQREVNSVDTLCPYGGVGDVLWVKETWATSIACDDRKPSDMEKPGRGYGWPVWYSADAGIRGRLSGGKGFVTKGRTRPSIFMPRWASRITLEITEVRVELLQDITAEDCIAEGIQSRGMETDGKPNIASAIMYLHDYETLWGSINGKTHPWASNPFCWAISFKRI